LNPCRCTRFIFSPTRPDLRCGPPNIFCGYHGVQSSGVERPERETDHSPYPVPRLRMIGAIPPILHSSSWREHAQLYLTFSFTHAYVSNYLDFAVYLSHYNFDICLCFSFGHRSLQLVHVSNLTDLFKR
jgi:hypothetical protein